MHYRQPPTFGSFLQLFPSLRCASFCALYTANPISLPHSTLQDCGTSPPPESSPQSPQTPVAVRHPPFSSDCLRARHAPGRASTLPSIISIPRDLLALRPWSTVPSIRVYRSPTRPNHASRLPKDRHATGIATGQRSVRRLDFVPFALLCFGFRNTYLTAANLIWWAPGNRVFLPYPPIFIHTFGATF
jgi:hypothetical protein